MQCHSAADRRVDDVILFEDRVENGAQEFMQLRILEIQSDAVITSKYGALGSSCALHEFAGAENHPISRDLGVTSQTFGRHVRRLGNRRVRYYAAERAVTNIAHVGCGRA